MPAPSVLHDTAFSMQLMWNIRRRRTLLSRSLQALQNEGVRRVWRKRILVRFYFFLLSEDSLRESQSWCVFIYYLLFIIFNFIFVEWGFVESFTHVHRTHTYIHTKSLELHFVGVCKMKDPACIRRKQILVRFLVYFALLHILYISSIHTGCAFVTLYSDVWCMYLLVFSNTWKTHNQS